MPANRPRFEAIRVLLSYQVKTPGSASMNMYSIFGRGRQSQETDLLSDGHLPEEFQQPQAIQIPRPIASAGIEEPKQALVEGWMLLMLETN